MVGLSRFKGTGESGITPRIYLTKAERDKHRISRYGSASIAFSNPLPPPNSVLLSFALKVFSSVIILENNKYYCCYTDK